MEGQSGSGLGAGGKGREGRQGRGVEAWGADTHTPPQETARPSVGAGPVNGKAVSASALPEEVALKPPALAPLPTAGQLLPTPSDAGLRLPSAPSSWWPYTYGPTITYSGPRHNPRLSSWSLPQTPTSWEPPLPRKPSPKQMQALLEMPKEDVERLEKVRDYQRQASHASPPLLSVPGPHTPTDRAERRAAPSPRAMQQLRLRHEERQPSGIASSVPPSPPHPPPHTPVDLPPPPTAAYLPLPSMANPQQHVPPPPPTTAHLLAQQQRVAFLSGYSSCIDPTLSQTDAPPSNLKAPPTHQAVSASTGPLPASSSSAGQVADGMKVAGEPTRDRAQEEEEEEWDQFGRRNTPQEQVVSQPQAPVVPCVPLPVGFGTSDVEGASDVDPEGGSAPSSTRLLAPPSPTPVPPLASSVAPPSLVEVKEFSSASLLPLASVVASKSHVSPSPEGAMIADSYIRADADVSPLLLHVTAGHKNNDSPDQPTHITAGLTGAPVSIDFNSDAYAKKLLANFPLPVNNISQVAEWLNTHLPKWQTLCTTPVLDHSVEVPVVDAKSHVSPSPEGPMIADSYIRADADVPPLLHVTAGHKNNESPDQPTHITAGLTGAPVSIDFNSDVNSDLSAADVNGESNGHGLNGQMAPNSNKVVQPEMQLLPVGPSWHDEVEYANKLLATFPLPVNNISWLFKWMRAQLPNWPKLCTAQDGVLWRIVQAVGWNHGRLRGNGLGDKHSFETRVMAMLKDMAVHTKNDGSEVNGACEELMRLLHARSEDCGDVDMAMVSYGDHLRGCGFAQMAHAAYLLAGMEPGSEEARGRSFYLIGAEMTDCDNNAASRGVVLASYLRTETVLYMRNNNERAAYHRIPLAKFPPDWLLSVRLTMIFSLLQERRAKMAEDLFHLLHAKLDGYITLPDARAVMSGLTIPPETHDWPYSQDAVQSYTMAWYGIVQQLGSETRDLPVSFMSMKRISDRLVASARNLHPSVYNNKTRADDLPVPPQPMSQPQPPVLLAWPQLTAPMAACPRVASPTTESQPLVSGDVSLSSVATSPLPPRESFGQTFDHNTANNYNAPLGHTPAPQPIEQRSLSPHQANSTHGLQTMPTHLTGATTSLPRCENTGRISGGGFAGASPRAVSPLADSSTALSPPPTRPSLTGGVQRMDTGSPKSTSSSPHGPKGPITSGTEDEVAPPPAPTSKLAYTRTMDPPKPEPSRLAKALFGVAVGLGRCLGWLSAELKQTDLGTANTLVYCETAKRWIDPDAPEGETADDPGSRPPPIFSRMPPQADAAPRNGPPITTPPPANDALSRLLAPPPRGLQMPRPPTATTTTCAALPKPTVTIFVPQAPPRAAPAAAT